MIRVSLVLPDLEIVRCDVQGDAALQLCDLARSKTQLKSFWLVLRKRDSRAISIASTCRGMSAQQLGLRDGDIFDVKSVCQHPVDDFLEKIDLSDLKRPMDPILCQHASSHMCDYCAPLLPNDLKHLKHVSFHSHLRNQLSTGYKPTILKNEHILEHERFHVLSNCPNAHKADSYCTKCMPPAVTLKRQAFRMIDHVEFESPQIIDAFLAFWRSSGLQRVGLLFGKYLAYDQVPLGIKAVVSAVYEPIQQNFSDGAIVDFDSQDFINDFNAAKTIAAYFELECVGIIFSDLVNDPETNLVVCKRHEKSFFLTNIEVLMAATLQTKFPVVSRFSESGFYGSRFVTCVASGDASGAIDVNVYQASESAVAMVTANIIQACTDPSKIMVKTSIPDIMFTEKNEYNTSVTRRANPFFPVDYLIVNMSHGFLDLETRVFKSVAKNFVYNNPQDLSNFDYLVYIQKQGVLNDTQMSNLCRSIRNNEYCSEIASLLDLMPSNGWSCPHCTFINISDTLDCDMCGLPK